MKRFLFYSVLAFSLAGCGQSFRASQLGLDGFITEMVGYKVDKFTNDLTLNGTCLSPIQLPGTFNTDHVYFRYYYSESKTGKKYYLMVDCRMDDWIFIEPDSKIILKKGEDQFELTTLSGSSNSRDVKSVGAVVYVSETALYSITREQLDKLIEWGPGTLVRIMADHYLDGELTTGSMTCLYDFVNGVDTYLKTGLPSKQTSR